MFVFFVAIFILTACDSFDKQIETANKYKENARYVKANEIYEKILQNYPTNKNIEKVKKLKEENDKTIFKRQNPLGYGYNDAKWGMSKEEVKKIITKKIIEETNDTITFSIKEGIRLYCYFFKDKFYRANYHIKDNKYNYTTEGLRATLIEKYGQNITANSDDNALVYIKEFVWEDKNTVILFDISIGAMIGYGTTVYDIIYYSKDISKEKDDYDKNLEIQKKQQQLQKDKEKIKKSLEL